MAELVIIASAKAKPGKEKDLENALREAAKPTRRQPGCMQFSLFRMQDNPQVIIGFERWSSKTDHDRHLQGAHIQKLMVAMNNIISEPPTIAAYEILDEA